MKFKKFNTITREYFLNWRSFQKSKTRESVYDYLLYSVNAVYAPMKLKKFNTVHDAITREYFLTWRSFQKLKMIICYIQ